MNFIDRNKIGHHLTLLIDGSRRRSENPISKTGNTVSAMIQQRKKSCLLTVRWWMTWSRVDGEDLLANLPAAEEEIPA